jgi:hypothetical protein
MKKLKDKVLACFYENTTVKIFPVTVTLFNLFVAAYRNPLMILKNCSVSRR